MDVKEAVPLSKEHIKALRKANAVSFHWNNKRSEIVLTMKDGKLETKGVIDCGYTHHRFDGVYGPIDSAFYMIHSAQYDQEWMTIMSLLKPGDKLILCWNVGSKSTEGLRKVGFLADSLSLIVERNDKRMYFHVGTTVCETRSTARMVSL